jgi:hypothetical protein
VRDFCDLVVVPLGMSISMKIGHSSVYGRVECTHVASASLGRHTYKILEPFTAIEATHPPASVHGRDE